jgi:hypothetical protein
METDNWNGGIAPPFLNSELDRGELSISRHIRFIPGETAPGTHSVEAGWAPQPVWRYEEEKIYCPTENWTLVLGRSPCGLLAIPTDLSTTLHYVFNKCLSHRKHIAFPWVLRQCVQKTFTIYCKNVTGPGYLLFETFHCTKFGRGGY